MEKKLKINFVLKGIAVFAFVAFCLLAILAGVTLPFVSSASVSDCAVASSESDYAIASAESDTFNPLDFSIPLRQCNTTDTYYGFYVSEEYYNYFKNFNFTNIGALVLFSFCLHNHVGTNYFACGIDNNVKYIGITNMSTILPYYQSAWNYSYYSPYNIINEGFDIEEIIPNWETDSSYAYFTDNLYVFTSIPYGIHNTPVPVHDFNSRFGNFRDLSSTDFYINLDIEPIIPEHLRQVTVGGGAVTNGWHISGQSTFSNIYFLNLFNRYYTNGTAYYGQLNCGWRVYTQTSPEVSATISFEVLGTVIWSADCDFTSTSDGGTVTNIRNGAFSVSSNYISDFNVFKISSEDSSLYLMNDIYKNIDNVDFFDSFVATQDFQNVKVPSDNALYLKGYQSASDNYYNNGYNAGFSVGKTDGYNTGFSAGDAQGYARGLESANTYSFLSLFGAIFDAPIQALFGGTQRLPAGTKITDSSGKTITLTSDTVVNRGGMLNFELMGVNLSGFVLALFSLSIIIIVIKFALAKK